MSRQGWFLLSVAAIVLCALFLRWAAVNQTEINGPLRKDAGDYYRYAYNLKHFGVFSRSDEGFQSDRSPTPDALRPPGYPVFIAAFLDDGKDFSFMPRVLMAQALLGTATVLVYLLIFRLYLQPVLAVVAAGFAAISPHLINSTVYVLTECLFTFLLGLGLLALILGMKRRSPIVILGGGFAIAASLLTRGTTLYLVLFLLPLFFIHYVCPRQQRAVALASLVVPIVLAHAAWSFRNLHAIGESSDPTLTANFLQHGMYINMMYEGRPETYGYPYRVDPLSDEMQGKPGRVLAEMGKRFLDEPARYAAWILVGKPMLFLSWNLTESVGDAFVYAPITTPYGYSTPFLITHGISKALHAPMMGLAIVAMIVVLWRAAKGEDVGVAPLVLSAVMLYFLMLHALGSPFPRYSIPTRPIAYGLAMLPLQWLWLLISDPVKSQ
ncbi:MAG: glycosyltransferase family 39 protein [Gammaproteobacteria bacterium]